MWWESILGGMKEIRIRERAVCTERDRKAQKSFAIFTYTHHAHVDSFCASLSHETDAKRKTKWLLAF